MARFLDLPIRLLVVLSLVLSSFPPAAVLAEPGVRPAYQTVEPPPAATAEPTATETATTVPPTESPTDTPTLVPTDTPTSVPTDTPTSLPSDTATPLPSDTATSTPGATETATPGLTETATATPPLTVTVTVTPTETATLTPTVELSPTATLTPTAPAPVLNLALSAEPAPVQAGQLITVTLTLSNPGLLALDSPVISATLPPELSYEVGLGAIAPGYNPIARLLTWPLPAEVAAQPEIRLGWVSRAAADSPAATLTLLAELNSPSLAAPVPAQTSLTITPAPQPLSLTMSAEPGFVNAGELVTVTVTLTNPSQIPTDNLVISTTLPLELGYDAPLGAATPGYNPIARLLTWAIPVELSSRPVLTVAWTGRVAADAPGSALSLAAEATPLGLQAQTGLIILAAATPTPIVAGPPARIQVGVEPIRKEAKAAEPRQWMAIYVTDADGLAVEDGTEVTLELPGGQVEQNLLKTKDGIVTTRFKTPAGQPFSLTARAGAAQGSLQRSGTEASRPTLLEDKLSAVEYKEEIQAILNARNALSSDGTNLTADNPTRRADFTSTGLTFRLKQQDDDLRGEKPGVPAEEQLTLSFELSEIRVGKQSLLSTNRERGGGKGNWVTYQAPSSSWQMAYEVGEATVEQYFIFEKGTPTDGDLVIEGRFETQLQATLLSNDQGIEFTPRQRGSDQTGEALSLGYGPAIVSDAQGRQMTAQMELKNKKLKITIPAAWLALAEFPVVVDPLIGPAELAGGLTGDINNPTVASDGTNFLSVWEWQGDIYGQLVNSSGALSGTLFTISQAAGTQHYADVVYNAIRNEYLVIWDDHRYGWTYNSIQAQRVSAGGQLLGGEIEILPPTKNVGYQAVAVSSAGDYLVVWRDSRGGSYDIYGQLMQGTGALSGAQLTLSNASNTQDYPDVAYDSQTNLFQVVWQDKRDGSTYDIYGQQVTAGGVISGSNQLLAGSGDSQDLRYPAVAGNGAEQFLVSWQRYVSSSNDDVHALRVAAGTGQAAGGILDIDIASGRESLPAVVGVSGGNYLLAWRDDGVIQAQVIPSSGTPAGTVSDLSEPTTGSRTYPALAHSSSQTLAIWSDTSQAGQYTLTGRRVPDGGSSYSGSEIYISPYYSRRERVAIASLPNSAESLLAWEQAAAAPADDIFIQRLDGQGQAVGDPLNVTNQAAAQQLPALAAGSSGYLAVWRDNRNSATSGLDIYGQLLDSSAVVNGSLIAITTAGNTQSNPAVAYNSQLNNYLVVWDDNRAGNNVDIYGQVVNANGSLGGGFTLSVANTQDFPEVAYNPDQNRYLAVWEDNRTSSSDDIYGQVISADGSLLGSSFAIAATTNSQVDPVVAYQPASQTYVVAWWDNRSGTYDIYGQVISGTGVLSGSNFAISTPSGTSNDQEWPDIVALPGTVTPPQFLVVWQDRRVSYNRDIYAQRVSAAGLLLDETDTITDETNPANNFVFDNSSYYTERPSVAYNSTITMALTAWNNRDDGGVYVQRYSPTLPLTPGAAFTAMPNTGVVPLTVTFSDTSSGTIVSRTWDFGNGITTTLPNSAPLSHTYITPGTFTTTLTITNPGGSASASRLITVTEQTTPSLNADFEAIDLGVDPTFWVDQLYDATPRDDFETLWDGDTRTLGTVYSSTNTVFSHYAIPGWASWKNYEYTGRMKMSDPAGWISVSVYSRYPANIQKVYVLRRFAGSAASEQFHLADPTVVTPTLQGDLDTGVTPLANTWYRFRVQAVTQADRITLRAKVWAEGQPEPILWQADGYDPDPSRSTAGAVAVRSGGPGSKYFDNLVVTPLALQADFTAAPVMGLAPFTATFIARPLGQVLTYTWNFGDGTPLFNTSAVTASHSYAQAGVYTVSLTVQAVGGSDTLTRPTYITATHLNSGLAGYWSLNESSGQRLDGSGYGNHLTPTGAVSYTLGQVGQAADLERDSSHYLSISHTVQSGLGITGSLTLAGWAKVESFNPSTQMILAGKYDYGSANRGYRLDLDSSGRIEFTVSPDGQYLDSDKITSTLTLTTGTWYHLAGVFDSQAKSLGLYLNGSLIASKTVAYNTIYPTTAPFMLGANLNGANASQPYDGLLDEWRVYARPLTGAEVQALMTTTPPTVTFTAAPLTGTVPLTVTFTATSTAASSHLWNFGDGLTQTQTSAFSLQPSALTVTHVYTQNGLYTVNLAASGPGGSATLTKTDYITAMSGVSANFSAFPLSGPRPLLVLFLNNSTGASSYAWDFGDGITSTLPGSTHTYTSLGVYTVTLTASNGTTSDTMTRTNYITVSETLAANFGAAPLTGTVPLTVTFVNSSTGASSYLWDFGNSITSTVISPTYVYTQAGVYTVTLMASDGTLTNTLTRTNYITVTAPISRAWQVMTTTLSPPIVGEQAMAYDSARNRVILYGGNAEGWPYEDTTWEFDGTDWLTITTATRPEARYGAGLSYDPVNEVTLLFGGSNEDDTAFNQTWEYTNTNWVQRFPTTSPLSRTYHSLATNPISGTIYLFGGNDTQVYFNDLWRYEDGDWTEISVNGPRPPARTLAAMTYIPSLLLGGTEGGLLLFGGRSLSGTLLADLWAFDPVAETWTELDDGGGGGPPARMAHTLTYDPATGNVVLVGGVTDEGDTVLTDTWQYNQNSWTEATPSSTPTQPAYHQAVYGNNVIILFSNGEVWKYE